MQDRTDHFSKDILTFLHGEFSGSTGISSWCAPKETAKEGTVQKVLEMNCCAALVGRPGGFEMLIVWALLMGLRSL